MTPANQRKSLGDALFHIRFPVMSLEEFSSDVATTDILSNQEALGVFMVLGKAEPKHPLPFSRVDRLPSNKVMFTIPASKEGSGLGVFSVSISVSHRVKVHGVFFHGPQISTVLVGHNKADRIRDVPMNKAHGQLCYRKAEFQSEPELDGTFTVSMKGPNSKYTFWYFPNNYQANSDGVSFTLSGGASPLIGLGFKKCRS